MYCHICGKVIEENGQCYKVISGVCEDNEFVEEEEYCVICLDCFDILFSTEFIRLINRIRKKEGDYDEF